VKRFWTKATTRESGPPRRSASWITARRAWLEVFANRVECGNWIIPFESVEGAVLYTGRQWFIPMSVLELRTSTATYQFGLNPWARPERHLPLEVERQEVRLGTSAFSLLLRIVLVAYLAFLVWRRLS